MIYLQFLIGALMYGTMAFASYNESFKVSAWYFPVGILSAVVANVLWFLIAKVEPNASQLMIKGLIWDAMLMLVYLIVPLVFFEARFTPIQMVGVGLTIGGLFLTKL